MPDEIRRHDPAPTAEGREWIESNPVVFAVRVAVFVVFAIAIGGYLSLYTESTPATVAKAGK
jgi:hypothetical protein